MRVRLLTRWLVLVLALLMPGVEMVATGCGATVASHHDGGPLDHDSHSSSSHERDSKRSPVQPSADCPMKAPCRTPALQTALPVLPTARLSAESIVDEPAAIPSGIDRTSLKPPPKRPA